jgi:putative transport protein
MAVFLGSAISRIQVGGFSLGSVGFLVAGIFMGLLEFNVPEKLKVIGALLFIYAIGIQSGPKILSIFHKNNIKYLWVAVLIFFLATAICFGISKIMGIEKEVFIGIYCAVFGTAAALANLELPPDSPSVLAYSLAYPVSLTLILIFTVIIIRRYHLKENPHLDVTVEKSVTFKNEQVVSENLLVERESPLLVGQAQDRYGVVITEITRNNQSAMAMPDIELILGDVLKVEGYRSNVESLKKILGRTTHLPVNHLRDMEIRQILITNRDVDGKTLKEVGIRRNYFCVINSIWRSGVLIAAPKSYMPLEIGDIVMATGHAEDLNRLVKLLGVHGRSAQEIDFLSMGAIITLGIILGDLYFKSPAGGALRIGFTGGTLLVALLVGYFRRIGFVYAQLSPQARMILKELGLTFFLLGVGAEAGILFKRYSILQLGQVISVILAIQLGFLMIIFFIIVLFRGRKKAATVLAIFCGAVTNTPAIGLVIQQTGSEEFMIPYASIYPIAKISMIFLTQILFVFY